MRSGLIYLGLGYLRFAGSHGLYWSVTAGASASAYLLYFDPSGAYPTALYNRYNGYSARCLASGA